MATKNKLNRFYISFADEKFRGAVLLECSATSSRGALREATRLKLNPGGQALVFPRDGENYPGWPDCARPYVNKLLLTREEIGIAFGDDGPAIKVKDMDAEAVAMVEAHSDAFCEDCNEPE